MKLFQKGGGQPFLRAKLKLIIIALSLLQLTLSQEFYEEDNNYQEFEPVRFWENDYLDLRNLQSSCLSTQYLNTSNKCQDCPSNCATCVSPTGSCEKCTFVLPTVTFAQQNQLTYGSGATCGENLRNCIYKDPFCTGDCGSTLNGGKCQTCLKGTAIKAKVDPTGATASSVVYSCQKCPTDYCTSCMLPVGSDTPTCLECERNFALQTDNSTGTPTQKCVRNSGYCPNFCSCDSLEALNSLNCTRCNDTTYTVVKEAGLSNYGRCVRQDLAATANLDCGERCTTCNTLTGTCLECEQGYAPSWDSTTNPGSPQRYFCQPICGPGCKNCNEATRSCIQCDETRNYTQYTIDSVTKTSRCYDISNMCDEACVKCDTSGLLRNPVSTVGVCYECKSGYFVNLLGKCEPCPALCNTCVANTGSCNDCTSIKYALYTLQRKDADPIKLCTDKLCSSACLQCNIEEGMNSQFNRPLCKKCSQGYYLTYDADCQLCPLNCGSCDTLTGKCNQCKPGFSLYLREGDPLCISDSTVGVCTVPHCRTCDAQQNTTCAICDPGYDLDPETNQCPCKITLAFKSRYFTQDWLQIQITWNGRVQASSYIDPSDAVNFCQILDLQTLTDLSQIEMGHSCYLKYDIQSKLSTFSIKLNPAWVIPNDGSIARNPTLKISFDITKLDSPLCMNPLDEAHFSNLTLTGGDYSNPTVVISRPIAEIPLCTQSLQISSGLTQGLFSRAATYVWSISSIVPDELNNVKKTALLNALNKMPVTSDVTLDGSILQLFTGKTMTLKLDVTNFLGKTGSGFITFTFLSDEGLMLKNVMEEYVINPQKDFQLTPSVILSACNFTSITVSKFRRLEVQCSIEKKDPVTSKYQFVSIIGKCLIPSGMMTLGTEYRVKFEGYDPFLEYTKNATKYSPIKLVKPPIIAKIIGGDQLIDSNKELTLAVRGENLSRDLNYKWSCKDPTTGLQCVDLYGNYLFLQGTDSIFIKAHILAAGANYQINFAAADQLDVSRIATDFVTVATLPKLQNLLQLTIISEANKYNNQLNVNEKQRFKVNVLNSASNPIADLSKYTFTWSVTDSINRVFNSFQANMSSMFIQSGYLQPNNIYQVCIQVTNSLTKELGSACTKYRSYGDSNMFSFTVNPASGNAYTTLFTFTVANTQTLSQQYFFEFGYIEYKLNAANVAIDALFMPFETSSPVMTKTFKMQPAQAGQSNQVKAYAKVTGETGEKYIYFQDLTINLGTLNATFIGDTITQVNFDNLNEVFAKVSQVSLVAATIEPKYKATVIKTLVSGISNITNVSLSGDSQASRFTIARSLSQVTQLIKGDPEIIGNKEKDMLKGVVQTIVGMDESDNEFFSSRKLMGSEQNQTVKAESIVTSSVLVKDTGFKLQNNVQKFDVDTAAEMLKICDDIYVAESLSNKTDPELKRVAVTGIKKILSGSINEITNTFSYDSATVKARSQVFIAGKESPAQRNLTLVDPLLPTTSTTLSLPNQDLCYGQTCQMNFILMKNPIISPQSASNMKGKRFIGSTVSLSFEKRTTLSESRLLVEQIDVKSLSAPVTIKMTLDLKNINTVAKQRCVFFDTKLNTVSDQGIITTFDSKTGKIQCDTYHLTDFSIIEEDPGAVPITTITPNLETIKQFKPLSMGGTTPAVIMMILSIILGFLIPYSLFLDKVGEASAKKEQFVAPEKREKTLTDVMFFNKYEERSKPQYAVANQNETNAEIEAANEEAAEEEEDGDDDDAYNILQRKLRREERLAKIKEAQSNNQARGFYSLFFMLCLALRFQHRAIQVFLVYDPSLSRMSRSWFIITSMFLSLAIIGAYCQAKDDSANASSATTSVGVKGINGIIISMVAQKGLLIILNLLMVKRPKLRRTKAEDKDLELNRPDKSGKKPEEKNDQQKFKEVISYKLSPCDKMSFSIGYFIIFAVIGASIFFCLMQSQKIDSAANSQWLVMFIVLVIVDFGIFEFVAIGISTILLKQVGSHPTALGRLRNYVLKFGPRAIKSAKVTYGEKQKKKPAEQPTAKQQEDDTPKREEKKRGSGNAERDARKRALRKAQKEQQRAAKAAAEAAKEEVVEQIE